jgi:mannose-6-phosphate isomerase-like protein (cupin superfamily)
MEHGVSYARLDTTGTERFVPLRQQLGVTSFGMNLILMHAGARGRIHRHAKQEEVYLVLEGTLSLSIEGVERDMHKGELARIAPEVRRQIINRGPERLVILALGAAGEHVGRDGTTLCPGMPRMGLRLRRRRCRRTFRQANCGDSPRFRSENEARRAVRMQRHLTSPDRSAPPQAHIHPTGRRSERRVVG